MTKVQDRKTPIWQTIPCAPWCTNLHEDGDHPYDRKCISDSTQVTLSLEPTVGGDGWPLMLEELRTSLQAAMPGAPAVVVFNHSDTEYLNLTSAEARKLAADLLARADAADASRSLPNHSVTAAVA